MEERTLNFAEKSVQVLTLEELERSYHENLPTGDPVGGIYHFALIQQVLEAFEQRGLKPVVQEIFAAANRDSKRPGVTLLPQLEEKYGERAIEAHLLRRVYANIEIRSDETEDVVTCLAVAYHQKGIQLGIGPMVKVCHNQTILGAQDTIANYACFGAHRGQSPSASQAAHSWDSPSVSEETIIINSAYRSAAVNKAVGGAATSNHLTGCAADIRCLGIEQAIRYAFILLDISDEIQDPFDELLIEQSAKSIWVHFAVRPEGNRRKVDYLKNVKI